MKCFFQTILIVAFSLLTGLQVSAQSNCSNINNTKGINTGKNHVFGPKAFGQSVVADASCMGGNAFTSFSYWAQGNSKTGVDFMIFRGKTTSGTPLVKVSKDLNAPNFSGKQTITFDPVSFTDGQTYTFICKLRWGNTIAHTTANAVSGEAYLQGDFLGNADLRFEVGAVNIAAEKNTLTAGQTLKAGARLMSANGAYILRMQEKDGNLCIYNYANGKQGRFVWGSMKYGFSNAKLIMQTDGNLVVYDGSNKAKWSSQPHPYYNSK